jgi:hypothetical protein
MMVARFTGTCTVVTGRLSASARLDSAIRNRANGRCRRSRFVPGRAARTSARLEKRTTARRRRRSRQM